MKAAGNPELAKGRVTQAANARSKATAKHTAFYNLKLVREALADLGPPRSFRWKRFRDSLIKYQTFDFERTNAFKEFLSRRKVTFGVQPWRI
jgi:hypothetical protein